MMSVARNALQRESAPAQTGEQHRPARGRGAAQPKKSPRCVRANSGCARAQILSDQIYCANDKNAGVLPRVLVAARQSLKGAVPGRLSSRPWKPPGGDA
jgi:hypothetical protein